MKIRMLLFASVVAVGVVGITAQTATAQAMQGNMGSGMMQGGADQQQRGEGMMQGRMMQGGSDMMSPMMRSGGTQGGMMGRGMMGGDMMGGAMGGGMGAILGSRVTPVMNLSVDDVRGYLASQLERLNNKRLKLGDITSGDRTITADIVTIDNSLVQRLDVDRHTGGIKYEN